MLTKENKKSIYQCVLRQFPDAGLYCVSRINDWLTTNGLSPKDVGYSSFRDFAEAFPEMFCFQDDNNDVFIEVKKWETGENAMANSIAIHPAEGFFGSKNIILNDDIIEMSQQSLYALTKVLGNGLNVQEMKRFVYDSFNEAKENEKLDFFAEKYIFPIDYTDDGCLVNGIVTKNISPRGKCLYFSFEKTCIRSSEPLSESRYKVRRTQTISQEDSTTIYNLLKEHFPFEKPLHMAAISKLLTDNNIDRAKYGCYKMKELLAQLDFLEMKDVVLGGVPQIMVTMHERSSSAEDAVSHYRSADDAKFEVLHNDKDSSTFDSIPNRMSDVASERIYGTAEYPVDANGIPCGRLEDFCNMPPKPMLILQRYIEGCGETADYISIRSELSDAFDRARNEGTIRVFEQKLIFPCFHKKENGTPVEITIKPSTFDGKPWFLYYVDTAVRDKSLSSVMPGKQLESFAFLGSWNSFLTELADKAIDEEWDFHGSRRKNYQILIQYIKFTFSRLVHENKVCISSDNRFSAFNTGLVDNHYDDIYACFIPNDSGSDTKWKFTGFCTAASGGLGKQLVNCFNPLPKPPTYFTRYEDLFFDLSKQLHPDFEHIIIDNIKRLPLQFLCDQFFDNSQARELTEKIRRCSGYNERHERNEYYEQLKILLSENNRLFIRIQNRIKDSIELAKKRVRWNYKTAIPSYFPRRNTMSLMLPLGLTVEEKPDVALVVELTQSGSYQGQTILTLPQAYIDARLLCRLSSDWLSPSQIMMNGIDSDEQDFASTDEYLVETTE